MFIAEGYTLEDKEAFVWFEKLGLPLTDYNVFDFLLKKNLCVVETDTSCFKKLSELIRADENLALLTCRMANVGISTKAVVGKGYDYNTAKVLLTAKIAGVNLDTVGESFTSKFIDFIEGVTELYQTEDGKELLNSIKLFDDWNGHYERFSQIPRRYPLTYMISLYAYAVKHNCFDKYREVVTEYDEETDGTLFDYLVSVNFFG